MIMSEMYMNFKTNERGIVCTINMFMGGYGYNDCGFKQQTDT